MTNNEQELKKAQAAVVQKLQNIYRVSALNLFNEIIVGSEVITGRLRGNWQATINQPSTEVLFYPPPKGGGEKQKITYVENVGEKLHNVTLQDTMYLVNNLPYALPLELGYSRQRPEGRVRTLCQAAQVQLDEAVSKVGNT